MAQLIDKDAAATEAVARKNQCRELLSSVNSLEVKEVDLNEEIEKCLKKHSMLAVGKKDFTDIAKHFFELGLNASNPLTWKDIRDIDDLLDDFLPSSFDDELVLKGYYQEVLKRFKAQKEK